jgi:FkbM family methyltransferase
MLNNTLTELPLKELQSICSEFKIPSYGTKKVVAERIQKMLLYETFTFSKFNSEIKIKDYRFDYIFEKIKMEKDFYEHELLDEIKSVISENSIVIDVGGHVGNHSIYLLKVCNFDMSYLFEPRKPLIRLIRENMSLNGLEDKFIINKGGIEAISSSSGQLKFEKRKNYNLGTGRIVNEPGGANVSTLDSIFEDMDKKISVIKIDVEGLEKEVLQGALTVIDKHRPVISIESLIKSEDQVDHDKAKQSLNDLIGLDKYKLHFSYGALPGPYTYIFVPKVVNP